MQYLFFNADPTKPNGNGKPIKLIGANLQKQYETWQRRARYKQSLDPTTEEVCDEKLCDA